MWYKYRKLPSDLDRWIGLALENKVKKLDIRGPGSYALPQPVFSSKTLTTLQLFSCSLDQPLSLFRSLKRLALSCCQMNGAIVLKHGDCPVFEDLELDLCWDLDSVHISNLLRLHTVEVNLEYSEFFETMEIASQIITSFTIRVGEYLSWSTININHLPHLKSLHLNSWKITDQELHTLLSKLPLLEQLYLFNCYQLKTIKITSPCLNTLEVFCCPDIIEIHTPSLKNFIFIHDDDSEKREKHNCEIMVADCTCRSLETLILFDKFITDRMLHKLISKFLLLQNLWIIGCHELKRIKVPNLQLKRLHIVRCFELNAVEVDSPNLSEFCYTLEKDLELSGADHARTRGGLKFEREDECTSGFWERKLKELLAHFVKDEALIDMLLAAVSVNYD